LHGRGFRDWRCVRFLDAATAQQRYVGRRHVVMYSATDIEKLLLVGLTQIRSGKTGTGSCGLCWFAEQEQGHPEVPEAFACAISVGSTLWGAAIQIGLGPSSGQGDVDCVPRSLWESRTLQYAWWVTAEFHGRSAMLNQC